MKIGTVAQHANIGPTGKSWYKNDLTKNVVPGRLNDYNIIGWWDFSDTRNLTTFTGNNVFLCLDKGPYDAHLTPDSTLKGPTLTHEGQDGYSYANFSNTVFDSMRFKNPIDIKARNFTFTVVIDMNVTTLTSDMTFFQINGDNNGKMFFMWDDYGSFDRLWLQREMTGQTSRYAYGSDMSEYFSQPIGGDQQYNFNWFTVVCNNDGYAAAYVRGKKITFANSGAFADVTFSKDSASYIMDARNIDTGETTSTGDAMSANVYEVMMFDQALEHQDLHQIDMYIKNKYKSYKYGRVNGQ